MWMGAGPEPGPAPGRSDLAVADLLLERLERLGRERDDLQRARAVPQVDHAVALGDLRAVRPAVVALERLPLHAVLLARSEEHTSELQSLMRIPYAAFCLKK